MRTVEKERLKKILDDCPDTVESESCSWSWESGQYQKRYKFYRYLWDQVRQKYLVECGTPGTPAYESYVDYDWRDTPPIAIDKCGINPYQERIENIYICFCRTEAGRQYFRVVSEYEETKRQHRIAVFRISASEVEAEMPLGAWDRQEEVDFSALEEKTQAFRVLGIR